MIYEEQQQRAFEFFIKAFKDALKNWGKNQRVLPIDSKQLGKAADLLIKLDEKIPDLKEQITYIERIKTIMSGPTVESPLSSAIQTELINLKNKIEQIQESLVAV